MGVIPAGDLPKGENSASPEPKSRRGGINSAPATLLVQGKTQQKSFLFLLEEKEIARQIKKYKENFFAGWRASASGGGAERQSSQSGFSSKKVRILTKRHRQKFIKLWKKSAIFYPEKINAEKPTKTQSD